MLYKISDASDKKSVYANNCSLNLIVSERLVGSTQEKSLR